jgi:hypothetical protein
MILQKTYSHSDSGRPNCGIMTMQTLDDHSGCNPTRLSKGCTPDPSRDVLEGFFWVIRGQFDPPHSTDSRSASVSRITSVP